MRIVAEHPTEGWCGKRIVLTDEHNRNVIGVFCAQNLVVQYRNFVESGSGDDVVNEQKALT